MEAQVLLKQGVIHRVGTGKGITILNDPWLDNDNDPYIHTEHEALTGKTVDSLMIPGQNSWDEDLIHDMFTERDANLIISIPLRISDTDSGIERKRDWVNTQ